MPETRTRSSQRGMAEAFRQALYGTVAGPVRLMEVCGTHSHAIGRLGLRQLLPPGMQLLSGPGCPVCVTAPGEVDAIIQLARRPGVTVCTFGDMMRVPGSVATGASALAQEAARGASVEVVYSPLQAVTLAASRPRQDVVFIGVGFETTAPAVAAAIVQAAALELDNFTVLCLHKLVPPGLKALLQSGEMRLDGLLCPGHVSAIIGSDAYLPLCRDHHLPCVIAGFEAADIMAGILRLAAQVRAGWAVVENVYSRAVQPGGNLKALALLDEVFTPTAAPWRGLGVVPQSGLRLRDEYAAYDAAVRHEVRIAPAPEPDGCCCGAVLRGVLTPAECPSFDRVCTPQAPVGPCMVSSEGSCAAAWRYSVRQEVRHA